MALSRRGFLTYLGLGTYANLRNPLDALSAADKPKGKRRKSQFFDPIEPSTDDNLILPAGYRYDLICGWGDPLGSKVPTLDAAVKGLKAGEPETFGFNNDFLAFFPLHGREGKPDANEGLLWVNHEYPDPTFVSGYTWKQYKDEAPKDGEQILKEKLCVGGSVLYVKRAPNGQWRCEHHKDYTRRFTALYPALEFTGPVAERAAGKSKTANGTLANCSGGRTPWFTALSCEENYLDYNEKKPDKKGYRWSDAGGIIEEQFGWIVEVDPYGDLPPKKHTRLGRFAHENAAMRYNGPKRRLVAYMGDDASDQFLYKFVSDNAYEEPPNGKMTREWRARMSGLLTEGTLYVARFDTGEWLPVSAKNPRLKGRKVKVRTAEGEREIALDDDATILLHTREAANVLGATPLDRPEDCEVHPADGSLFVAMTNNIRRANFHGQIVRLIEDNDNPEGTAFRFEVYLAGGKSSGLACPDNLAFDRHGNLWVACDMAAERIGKGPYQPFGNNGLFVVPTLGKGAGDAHQFASGPVGSELTGPWFADDGQTLFLAVQHPGEESPDRDNPNSHWPDGGKKTPRPAVVAISGFPK